MRSAQPARAIRSAARRAACRSPRAVTVIVRPHLGRSENTNPEHTETLAMGPSSGFWINEAPSATRSA
ncbi:Uncharacterised protein [Bordetella pertussis]|nr:Uncharacterised protein [Bordetella pertussis]